MSCDKFLLLLLYCIVPILEIIHREWEFSLDHPSWVWRVIFIFLIKYSSFKLHSSIPPQTYSLSALLKMWDILQWNEKAAKIEIFLLLNIKSIFQTFKGWHVIKMMSQIHITVIWESVPKKTFSISDCNMLSVILEPVWDIATFYKWWFLTFHICLDCLTFLPMTLHWKYF